MEVADGEFGAGGGTEKWKLSGGTKKYFLILQVNLIKQLHY